METQVKIEAPPELVSLCREVEVNHIGGLVWFRMKEQSVFAAVRLYAKAVEYCDQEGFPYASIRIAAASGGQKKTRRGEKATMLRWNGREWKATREFRNVYGKDGTEQHGISYLELEDRPTALHHPLKAIGQSLWRITLGHFAFDLDRNTITFSYLDTAGSPTPEGREEESNGRRVYRVGRLGVLATSRQEAERVARISQRRG